MSFIEFSKIEKSFGEKKVLDGLSLKVEKGETLTILGGSGSGKTILLKALLRLLMIDRGRILFEGKDVLAMDEKSLNDLRTRMGIVFQGGALFDSLSIYENVAYPLREHFDYPESKIAKTVSEKLALVGLPGIEDMKPSDLSGGMRKRVSLARTIATNPEVILYDEPTTGLDPINTLRVDNLIQELQKKLNVTSIVVTHDIASAFRISDRLALLYKGKIEFVGTVDEMRKTSNARVRDFISLEGGGRAVT